MSRYVGALQKFGYASQLACILPTRKRFSFDTQRSALIAPTLAVFAASRWWRRDKQTKFQIKYTPQTGLGLFATRSYRRDEQVFRLTEPVRRWNSRTIEDAQRNENWFGAGKNRWT